MTKAQFDPRTLDPAAAYKIMSGTVVPRPIALVSSVDACGVRNLAPFSWFNALSSDPPYLCISIGAHPDRPKDTLRNILATREFVVNLVDEDIVAAQDLCAQACAPDVDEFVLAGLSPVASRRVAAPSVTESKVNFECRLFQATQLPNSSYTLIVAEVIWISVDDRLLTERGRIDASAFKSVGRLAGNAYCKTSDTFTLDHDAFNRFAE